MKRIMFFFVLFLISTIVKSQNTTVNKVLTSEIKYTYTVEYPDLFPGKNTFTFTGKGLDDIMRGYLYYVISKSSDFTHSNSYAIRLNRFSPQSSGPTIRSYNCYWEDDSHQFLGLTDNVILGTSFTAPVDGTYYQCMVLYYYSNSEKKWKLTAFKEQSDKKIIIGTPDPEPPTPPTPQKFDLSLESITITPTSTSSSGNISASVKIKNKGNKDITNCYVRFFLSKYNTVTKPYQCLFSPELSIGTVNAGGTISSSTTLFLSQAFASAGSYYVIADIYSRSSNDDSDESNNQKSTGLKITGTKTLNIMNKQSSIHINNITNDDLGNTIFITGSNASFIKKETITTTEDINIINIWSDPVLFITIVNKDGVKQTFKLNNTNK